MKKTVLVTAYAVNPFKGSEDGTGWNIIRNLADQNNIVAITRKNNRADIERYLDAQALPEGQQLHFEYFDLPTWLSFWKKGGRGSSVYHYLWHLGVVFFIMKKRFKFEIAHHLNFHCDWTPTFLWLLGKPFVWGPLGHHHKIPRPYALAYGKKFYLLDRLMWSVKWLFWTFDPFLKISKWTASKVVGVNTSVFEVLKVPAQKRVVLPAVATETPNSQPMPTAKFQVLTIGRFVPLKAFDLAIRSFAHCFHQQIPARQAKMQLTLIGQGPEKASLQQIAEACQLPSSAILFVDWLTRSELDQYFATSKLYLFPSHEGAGMVIPEAFSYGLPVVCFDNYGPGELVKDSCAIRIPYSNPEASIAAFSRAIGVYLHDEEFRSKHSENALQVFKNSYTWSRKALVFQAIYDEIAAVEESLAMA